jgi:F420-dependent oxidoreductase-like protein
LSNLTERSLASDCGKVDGMLLRVFTEPQQGASYDDLLRVAKATEHLGFDAFFRSDHYLAMGVEGLPGSTDAWITLAGLARETARIRLGTLVSSVTFRYPGTLAISVAQVDQMSGGRVELGLGAGWYEAEHRAYGMRFPDVHERFDQLEEALEVVNGLWSAPIGTTYSHAGAHFPIEDSPALPKPVQTPRPPIIVGGGGARRTPELAARYADEFNRGFVSVEDTEKQFARVRAACDAAGRAADSLVYSVAQTVCCGSDDAEIRRRADAIGVDLDDLRLTGLAGTPDELVDKIGRFGAVGATRVYLQTLDLADLDHLELIASQVLPQL